MSTSDLVGSIPGGHAVDQPVMDPPKIASQSPSIIELEPGDYWWCACGHSRQQPFCDGSHKGSGYGPEKVSIGEKKTVALCNCKRSGNKPFCDGSHTEIAP
jgi:CDGSH-type Zn-finger protein